jgi:hypothetical protein
MKTDEAAAKSAFKKFKKCHEQDWQKHVR